MIIFSDAYTAVLNSIKLENNITFLCRVIYGYILYSSYIKANLIYSKAVFSEILESILYYAVIPPHPPNPPVTVYNINILHKETLKNVITIIYIGKRKYNLCLCSFWITTKTNSLIYR